MPLWPRTTSCLLLTSLRIAFGAMTSPQLQMPCLLRRCQGATITGDGDIWFSQSMTGLYRCYMHIYIYTAIYCVYTVYNCICIYIYIYIYIFCNIVHHIILYADVRCKCVLYIFTLSACKYTYVYIYIITYTPVAYLGAA